MTNFKSKPIEVLVKVMALLLSPFFAVPVMAVAIIGALVVLIRYKLYADLYYFRKKRDYFTQNLSLRWSDIHGNHDRPRWSLTIGLNDWSPHYTVDKQGDGEHGQGFVAIAWFFGISLYVTIEKMFPVKWFEDISYKGEKVNWIDRTYGWSIHHWGIWFDWGSEDGGMAQHRGYKFDINFLDMLIGRHSCEFELLESEYAEVNMAEGIYPVVVFKQMRIDSWQRWFTKRRIQWEVVCGKWKMFNGIEGDDSNIGWYFGQELKAGKLCPLNAFKVGYGLEIREGSIFTKNREYPIHGIIYKLDEAAVPIPGKGENDYDQEGSGRQSVIFSVDSGINSFQEAADRFAASIQETRSNRGSKDWRPSVVPPFVTQPITDHQAF